MQSNTKALMNTKALVISLAIFAYLQSELRKAIKFCFCSSVRFIWKR
jgi:hypothetical protein